MNLVEKILLYLNTIIITILTIFLLSGNTITSGRDKEIIKHDTIYKVDSAVTKMIKQNLEIAENKVTIDKDSLRIQRQLAICEKYRDSLPTNKNVKKLCIELFTDSIKTRGKLEDYKVAYGKANKETAFRVGTARSHNNLFGLKYPRRWESVAVGPGFQNNAYYDHWSHGFIDVYTRYVVLRKRMWHNNSMNLKGIND